jgi:hypothetical protein
MQNAFSAGPLHCSLPAIAAGEPVAGIALGIVVFGDRIQISAGQLAIEAGGIAALIVGVVTVARSSAFSGLRKITEVIDHAHRHEAPHATPVELNGQHPEPDGQHPEPDGQHPEPNLGQATPLDARHLRRAHPRPLHGPASGEGGG